MSNTNVIYFPPNITSLKESNDRGIIRAFKAIVRQHQLQWIIEQLDTGIAATADEAKPNVRQAIERSKEAWARLSENTKRNCWNSAKVLSRLNSSPVALQNPVDTNIIAELAALLMSFGADVSTAEEMCEIDEELWTAAPIKSDNEDAELLEVLLNEPSQETEEDDSTYRVPITLCTAKENMEELKYFIQQNQPAMQIL